MVAGVHPAASAQGLRSSGPRVRPRRVSTGLLAPPSGGRSRSHAGPREGAGRQAHSRGRGPRGARGPGCTAGVGAQGGRGAARCTAGSGPRGVPGAHSGGRPLPGAQAGAGLRGWGAGFTARRGGASYPTPYSEREESPTVSCYKVGKPRHERDRHAPRSPRPLVQTKVHRLRTPFMSFLTPEIVGALESPNSGVRRGVRGWGCGGGG